MIASAAAWKWTHLPTPCCRHRLISSRYIETCEFELSTTTKLTDDETAHFYNNAVVKYNVTPQHWPYEGFSRVLNDIGVFIISGRHLHNYCNTKETVLISYYNFDIALAVRGLLHEQIPE